jgi:3-phenylpropionate/trans-cinnamate dioxygenase ferredoxin reductase component
VNDFELLIVGGGPAGLAAARAFRDSGGQGAVAIVGAEERPPYRRPPLTKELLRGEIPEAELGIEPDAWFAQHGVALIEGRAVALDDRARQVRLSGGRTLHYRTCLIATGAEPLRPAIPGVDDPGVRVVRTLSHVRDLLARLRDAGPVVVIGSGFVGCELSASLAMRGHTVQLISSEPAPNQRRLGAEAAGTLAGWLTELGIELVLGRPAASVQRCGDALLVTAGDARLQAATVVAAVGVSPRSELVAGSVALAAGGAIPVDASMRTALPGVLAAGDVAYALNATAGRRLRVEHWGDALGQGTVAGRTAAGAEDRWGAVPGFWSTIGTHTLKYVAWGDGYDTLRTERDGTSFTVWYARAGQLAGVLCHGADEDYARGRELIAQGAAWR